MERAAVGALPEPKPGGPADEEDPHFQFMVYELKVRRSVDLCWGAGPPLEAWHLLRILTVDGAVQPAVWSLL